MIEDNKLLRLSLQFFGDPGDDGADEDFDDDLFDDEDTEYDDYDGEEDDEEDGEGDEDSAGAEGDEDADKNNESGDEGGADNAETNNELISELRALGYVGNDLASLTKDMKAKREARASQDAKEENEATKAAGKSHLRTSRPGKGATGVGTGGINERQVDHFVSITKASRETARQTLSKHARLINGR